MTSIRSYLNQLLKKQNVITVVSGLPRSGTSMMMSALKAGGLPLLTDNLRAADPNNPKGYFEYERVKKLQKGDTQWLNAACGKAVKIISSLLINLPDNFHYRIIFMERELDEILASQARMLARNGIKKQHSVSYDDLRVYYKEHLSEIKGWLEEKGCIQTLFVSYNEALRDPLRTFEQVAMFLENRVNPKKMAQIVDTSLYREHS